MCAIEEARRAVCIQQLAGVSYINLLNTPGNFENRNTSQNDQISLAGIVAIIL